MKILIIAIPGIGNTLLAVPLLKELKATYNNARIDLLVGLQGSKEIIMGCPYIDKVYLINKKIQQGLFKNLHTISKLRANKYDVSITTFPAAQPHYNLLASFIGARKKITHNYKRNLVFLQDKRAPIRILHDVEQNLSLLRFFGINAKKPKLELWLSKEEKDFANKFAKRFKEKHLVGMHPGTSIEMGMKNKRWPLTNFAELADKIIESKKNTRVIVFLGSKDAPLEKIKELIKSREKVTLIKNLDIRKVAAIIAKCKYFISNDSGLMHIAVACGIPTAGIFVSTDYRRTSPYGKKHLVLKKDQTYKAFRQSIEELSGIKTNWRKGAVKQVTVENVMNAIKRKLI